MTSLLPATLEPPKPMSKHQFSPTAFIMSPFSASSRRTRSQSTAKANLKIKETQAVENHTVLRASELSAYKMPTKKRKITSSPSLKDEKKQRINVSAWDGGDAASSAKKKKQDSSITVMKEEKRLRVFRKKAPLTYMTKLERATSQRWMSFVVTAIVPLTNSQCRMFVIERTRGGTDGVPEELIVMAGSTGNLYNINIGLVPSCNCPDNKKGNQCKHIVYVGSL